MVMRPSGVQPSSQPLLMWLKLEAQLQSEYGVAELLIGRACPKFINTLQALNKVK